MIAPQNEIQYERYEFKTYPSWELPGLPENWDKI